MVRALFCLLCAPPVVVSLVSEAPHENPSSLMVSRSGSLKDTLSAILRTGPEPTVRRLAGMFVVVVSAAFWATAFAGFMGGVEKADRPNGGLRF
jgi:hypothetical protein